ncbi:MAG TPA: xanthine dehydrogenase family protein molybdopterin-binding subunit [Solirubrobacteraceae bacterium]|nr:xanthine dehydrogenase family protein molybdopterin-binding subunit [Solirubrobacteraceae bacterium]
MSGSGLIGAPLTRREDDRILRGETRYLDDITPSGALHAAFVRSPHAHAAITAVRVPADAAGVVAVLTAADLPAVAARYPVMEPRDSEVRAGEAHPVLAEGEVRYAGQPVAIVLAPSRALAEDGVELVDVEYEVREPVLAVRDSDLVMMGWSARRGDVAAAFAAAAHVVSGSYALPRLIAAPMEARGAIAEHDAAADVLTVWCSAQDTHRPLAQLAHILARPEHSVRVIVPDVGGAFGSKGVVAPEVAAVAAAALALGVPVKWTEDRLENLVGAYQGRGIEGDLELALDPEGRMLGLRARLWADLGGYLLTTTTVPPHTAGTLITGCYDIPAAEVQVRGVRTHRVPTGPYRGAGRPDAAYMIESLVDAAARATGIDRVTLRRRNLIRRFPYRTATGLEYDSGDFERCLDLALGLTGAPAGPRADTAGPAAGAVRGRGVAVFIERAGGAWETAEIALTPGGRFRVSSSSSPHGQGHDITFAQIAADRLRVPVDAVALRFGDSALTPAGVGTFGSRSVAQGGSAVALAADELVARARERVASLTGCDPAAVGHGAEGFSAGERTLSWAALAETVAEAAGAGGDPEPLEATARFQSANVFSSGAYVANVSIDGATGELSVERLAAVDDAGTVINPLLVHGQVLGGAVQALGECLTEEAIYDDAGQLRTGSFLDYSLLTAAEIPPIITGEVQTPSPLNPLGAKGAGEAGAVGTLAAVANAVTDALGGRVVAPPFTAEKLWRALGEGPAGSPPGPPVETTALPHTPSAATARRVRVLVRRGAPALALGLALGALAARGRR